MKIKLKDLLDGAWYEYQVCMRTDHPASSYGQPVMEFADGKLCGADCWLLGCGQVVRATKKEKEMFDRWIDLIETMTGMKKAGAPAGNQNAAKPDADKRTSRITIHVTAHEKAGCVKLAGGKINAWGRKKFGLPE
jgi:hypothetical protein